MRTPFAVGRLDRRTREVTWVRAAPPAPFPGPWSVASRVRAAPAQDQPEPSPDEGADPASDPMEDAGTPTAHDLPADGTQLRLL